MGVVTTSAGSGVGGNLFRSLLVDFFIPLLENAYRSPFVSRVPPGFILHSALLYVIFCEVKLPPYATFSRMLSLSSHSSSMVFFNGKQSLNDYLAYICSVAADSKVGNWKYNGFLKLEKYIEKRINESKRTIEEKDKEEKKKSERKIEDVKNMKKDDEILLNILNPEEKIKRKRESEAEEDESTKEAGNYKRVKYMDGVTSDAYEEGVAANYELVAFYFHLKCLSSTPSGVTPSVPYVTFSKTATQNQYANFLVLSTDELIEIIKQNIK
jgi:hypothetical protein